MFQGHDSNGACSTRLYGGIWGIWENPIFPHKTPYKKPIFQFYVPKIEHGQTKKK